MDVLRSLRRTGGGRVPVLGRFFIIAVRRAFVLAVCWGAGIAVLWSCLRAQRVVTVVDVRALLDVQVLCTVFACCSAST